MVVTRFHAQWNVLFTGSKQKLIVMLYLSYLLLPNKDSVRQSFGVKEIGRPRGSPWQSNRLPGNLSQPLIFRLISLDKRNFLWYC